MSISIKVAPEQVEQVPPEPQGIKIEVIDKDEIDFKLMTRSAINGDIMILDHKDIDIVLQQKGGKILTFAKETISDFTYGAEARLLEFMRSKGILEYDSIQGGNIYGSLEGQLMTSEDVEVNKVALKVISEWMSTEESYLKGSTAYDDMSDDHLLSPDGEFSTELGEVPAEEKKGSINQHNLFAPYLYGRYTYE
tara:strand:- start:1077 stop:1658 length:582 start_codon:yes stop_codon:yes gene_type:complete